MNYIKYLFTKDFLFHVNSVRLETVDRVFLVASLLGLVFGVGLWIWMRVDTNLVRRAVVRRYKALSFTFGLLGVLWFALRYENVAWFGSHFAFILLLVVVGIWKIFLAKYLMFHYCKDLAVWEREQVKNKYLEMK